MRHLQTQVLWVQEAVARRELTNARMPGCDNPANLETKHLVQREMHECMRRAGCQIAGGCSRLALRVAKE